MNVMQLGQALYESAIPLFRDPRAAQCLVTGVKEIACPDIDKKKPARLITEDFRWIEQRLTFWFKHEQESKVSVFSAVTLERIRDAMMDALRECMTKEGCVLLNEKEEKDVDRILKELRDKKLEVALVQQ